MDQLLEDNVSESVVRDDAPASRPVSPSGISGALDQLRAALRQPVPRSQRHIVPLLEDRVTVQNYRELGQLIIDWSLGRKAVPRSIDELRAVLTNIAEIPAHYTSLNIVASDSTTFTFRLPEPDLLQASMARAMEWDQANPDATREEIQDGYALPRFYDDLFSGVVETSLTELFERRIGDYIIASCK